MSPGVVSPLDPLWDPSLGESNLHKRNASVVSHLRLIEFQGGMKSTFPGGTYIMIEIIIFTIVSTGIHSFRLRSADYIRSDMKFHPHQGLR